MKQIIALGRTRVSDPHGLCYARVSSSDPVSICTSGPTASDDISSNNRVAPESSYRLNSVAFTVSTNPRREPNVSLTAEASYPLCTMQLAQRGLPDSVP